MSRSRSELRRREPQPVDRLTAAGLSDAGLQREVNEDRFHIDLARGIFIVIDGVGGHAAGGKAADVALSLLRERLERETGRVADRIREAITIANNEICRLASTRPEWDGMACVLTVAVIEDSRAIIGHVGDTRLYKIGTRGLEKVTLDHSPVGEREDARELSESEAMRHPRRNEVYRDVGSEPHDPFDAEFVDVKETTFESDDALLLCSDGLTDLVDSAAIVAAVRRFAGDPHSVVAALVDAANQAGGKDNVTVVYVEGNRFTAERVSIPAGRTAISWGVDQSPAAGGENLPSAGASPRQGRWVRRVSLLIGVLLLIVIGFAVGRWYDLLPAAVGRWSDLLPTLQSTSIIPSPLQSNTQVVEPAGSITAAINKALPGSEIVVEPGEYREQLRLKDRVRLVSRVPGGANLRLPANAIDGAAVIANGLSQAELVGFRIVGDAATPLGVGIFVDDSALLIADVEIAGASRAAIEFGGARAATLLASDIHDNPGAGVVVYRGAAPRIVHNTFRRNGISERAIGALSVDEGAAPLFRNNSFIGLTAEAFAALEKASRLPLSVENWFIAPATGRSNRGSSRPAPAVPSRSPQARP